MRSAYQTLQLKLVKAHVAIAALCALALLIAPASAQDESFEAGVIIDYGDDRITWMWIPFDDPETPLVDLINETDLEMVTVGFGGLGEGVCQIDDTGCPVGDCRQRLCQTSSSSPFWRVMKLGDEEWSMVSSGISGSKVIDGEIYALSWSSENPELPVVSIDELATNAGADRDTSNPVAAIRTEGEAEESDSSPAAWAPAIGALGIVMVVAGALIYRSRARRGSPS